ncbi:MAG: UDP-N-acetylmuramoyl-L-alanyl-D-glutamate--2,6-diaminopimelate ligase [Bacteroidales bacterium]
MKNLGDILYKTGLQEVAGTLDLGITSVASDSRKVTSQGVFVAVRGLQTDGHLYIDQAISTGAVAIVCEEMPASLLPTITYVRVQNSSKALGMMASNFYNQPSARLKLVGVTGTNGKTTIVTLLHELFTRMGYTTGLLSTVRNLIGNQELPSLYTTPDPVSLNQLLNKMVEAGCEYAFMEVSSHALAQHRTEGLHFAGGVFTNITHDHLDYHKTFRNYLETKKSFFDHLEPGSFALSNLDDKNGWVMLQNTKATKNTYSLRSMADFRARVMESSFTGMQLQINNHEFWCRLIGQFNAYNLLAAYGTAILLGEESEMVLTSLSSCTPAEGRFEFFTTENRITAIVDYAHTPDALENVLKTVNSLRTGTEKIITVVGAGGNRDATKRPEMASIAVHLSDKIILTSDNPRFEEPEEIIRDMKAGLDPVSLKRTHTVINRREAISVACGMASPGDIVLVAGKGHEKYQEIKGVKYPFDDMILLKEFLT